MYLTISTSRGCTLEIRNRKCDNFLKPCDIVCMCMCVRVCVIAAKYSPGSSLYIDLRPGWSTTTEHKRWTIAGSRATTERADPTRWCGAASGRRVHRQSRRGSALEGASTCRERTRVLRGDGSWRWHNLKNKKSKRFCLQDAEKEIQPEADDLEAFWHFFFF